MSIFRKISVFQALGLAGGWRTRYHEVGNSLEMDPLVIDSFIQFQGTKGSITTTYLSFKSAQLSGNRAMGVAERCSISLMAMEALNTVFILQIRTLCLL